MRTAQKNDNNYRRLSIAIDGKVAHYALAPDATLSEVGEFLAKSSCSDAPRWRTVRVMIDTVPSR